MKFKSRIKAVSLLEKVCSSLASLSPIAWCRITPEELALTVVPDKGSQCWTKLLKKTIFDKHLCESAADNTINLEIPLAALSRALKSAVGATEVWIRLTKKDQVPVLCISISTQQYLSTKAVAIAEKVEDEFGEFDLDIDLHDPAFGGTRPTRERQRQTLVTQDIPVKVLHAGDVGGIHEPRLREPDIHIYMPNLAQVKSISDRYTRMAISSTTNPAIKNSPKLQLSANMYGRMTLSIKTESLSISSQWTGLLNPDLDSTQFDEGEDAVRNHPSTRKKNAGGPRGEDPAGWATINIDARDWSRVLSVGRVSKRVVGCIVEDLALVMYCWIGSPDDGDDGTESCLTVRLASALTYRLLTIVVLYQQLQSMTEDKSRKLHE